MATAFTQVYQYARPDNVDISILGKAQTYKQQLYDTNVAQTQQLINQYAGVDLMRDVDQKYLGERLNTLVNYVNQSGAQDWSRRSIVNEVSNYIGQALDENVMAGIASTQRYRKQMSEIEDIKKNKPDLYSSQNEWFATRDLQRYLTSNKIGDTYKAGSYIPYLDMDKEIIKNSEFYKQYGAEVKYEPISGNAYFTHIGKIERLSENEARNLIALTLGDKGQTQMMINGAYNYKDYSPDDIKKIYIDNLSNQKKQYDDLTKSISARMTGATKDQLEELKKGKDIYATQSGQLNSLIQNADKVSKDGMTYQLYSNDFLGKWGKAMSYTKVTDMIIDESGYKTAKFNWDMKNDIWEQNFKANQAILEQTRWKKDFKLKNIIAAKKDGISLDEKGNVVESDVSNSNGMTMVDAIKKTEDKNPESIKPNQIVEKYSNDWKVARTSMKSDIENLKKTESGREVLEKVFGSEAESNVDRLTWLLVQNNAESNKRFTSLKGIISNDTYDNIFNAKKSYHIKTILDNSLKNVENHIEDIATKIVGNKNAEGFYGLSDFYVTPQGNVVKGKYTGEGTRSYDKLSQNSKIGAKIGILTSLIRDNNGELTDDQVEQLKVLKNNYISKLPSNEREKISLLTTQSGYWEATGKLFKGLGNMAVGLWHDAGWFQGDQQHARKADEAWKNTSSNLKQFRYGMVNKYKGFYGDLFNGTFDIEDLSSNDLGKNWAGKDDKGYGKNGKTLLSELKLISQKADNDLQELKTTYQPKIALIDMEGEGKKFIPFFKAMAPGLEMDKTQPISIQVNENNPNTASVTMYVKDGKNIIPHPISEVKLAELPKDISKNIQYNSDKFLYDPINNKNPMPFNFRYEFADNEDDLRNRYGFSDPNYRDNHFTKDDVIKNIENRSGKDFIKNNKEEINAILSKPVDFDGFVVGNKYIMDISSGNTHIRREDKLDQNNIAYQKDLMEQTKSKIATEEIISFILKTLNKQK